MKNREELNEYGLKIHKVVKYYEQADEYKNKEIFSSLIAGVSGIIDVCLISTLSNNTVNTSDIVHFIGSLGYSFLTAMAISYAIYMNKKKKEYEDKALFCKKSL